MNVIVERNNVILGIIRLDDDCWAVVQQQYPDCNLFTLLDARKRLYADFDSVKYKAGMQLGRSDKSISTLPEDKSVRVTGWAICPTLCEQARREVANEI